MHTRMHTCMLTPGAEHEESFRGVLRLRGLPWTAKEEDIASFFSEFGVGKHEIALVCEGSGRST